MLLLSQSMHTHRQQVSLLCHIVQVVCSAGRVHDHTQGRNRALLRLHNQDTQACAFWVELTLLQAKHQPAEQPSSSSAASGLHGCCSSLSRPADEQQGISSVSGQLQQLQRHHGHRQRVLPVWWSDNHLTLAPGEAVCVEVCWRGSVAASVEVQGWNVAHQRFALKP